MSTVVDFIPGVPDYSTVHKPVGSLFDVEQVQII
jgi:hypothetical protein